MQILLKIMLGLHIASGFLALLTGCISVMSPKGKKVHRRSGLIFFYCMLGVTFTALVISIAHNNSFLLMIAIFSFYQNYMGYRAIRNKSLKPLAGDWLVLAVGATNAFFMIYSLNIVLMVFGGICAVQAINNFRENLLTRSSELPPLAWLRRHIGMMMGAYIATITAFIVVNSSIFAPLHIPGWLPWLLPSMILVPLIAYYIVKYTVKPLRKRSR